MEYIMARGQNASALAVFLSKALEDISYRTPRMVMQLRVVMDICGETGFYVCPRCNISLDREFMTYCNNCGQKLNWRNYQNAQTIYLGKNIF